MLAFDQAQEDVVLAQEPGGGRNAGQRKQEEQHQHGFDRRALVESSHIVDLIANHVALAQGCDHRERA